MELKCSMTDSRRLLRSLLHDGLFCEAVDGVVRSTRNVVGLRDGLSIIIEL